MSDLSQLQSQYKQQLDQWTKSLGLSRHQPSNGEVESILGFSREDLRERSQSQLAEDAIILSQYALFLQDKINSCRSFLKWAGYVASHLFGDDRSDLQKLVRLAELRITRIEYLARRIESIGQAITGLVKIGRAHV